MPWIEHKCDPSERLAAEKRKVWPHSLFISARIR